MRVFVNGRVVGKLDPEENVFYKSVKPSKHLFRSLNAYGMDQELLGKLAARGADIVVRDTENDRTYRTTARHWEQVGEHRAFPGHGAQVFLPLDKFDPDFFKAEQPMVQSAQHSLFQSKLH